MFMRAVTRVKHLKSLWDGLRDGGKKVQHTLLC